MRVLVTGAFGFVGRHFDRYYRAAGYDVMALDIVAGDDCREFFDNDPGQSIDLVIHCAAVVGGRAGIDGQPLHLMAEDLSIDAALFRWALRAKPKRIVCFSSSAVYNVERQQKPCHDYCAVRLQEDKHDDGDPDASYGLTKVVLEHFAEEANAIGIDTHVFRPFSGYGTEQSLDYPFPSFIRRAAQREAPFDIIGDGSSARDWVHIDDIVGAVLAAIDNDVLGPVNICTGRATTFDELAQMCMQREGYKAPIRYVDGPQGVHWRVGDPTKLNEFYTPRITLEEGIARALEAAHA